MITLATVMFHHIWKTKSAQTVETTLHIKRQIAEVEKSIDQTVDKFVAARSGAITRKLEDKVESLELEKARLVEKLSIKAEPGGSIEEKLEPALAFLSNPWKLWATGQIKLRRLVLKLAFTSPIRYCQNEGARTAGIAFPFKALTGGLVLENGDGGA